MQFSIERLSDYNLKVKLKSGTISCYSKNELKKKYPEKTYTLVGETKKTVQENDQKGFTAFYDPQTLLSVSNYKDNSRILYREAGYVSVGNNKYIAILKSRIPFLLFFLAGLIILGIVLYLLLRSPKNPGPDVPLPETDPFVQVIPDDDDDPPSTGGNTVSMSYVLKAKTSKSTGEVGIYFANPSKSDQDVVLELYIENGDNDILLATSGLIRRGNRLLSMTADKELLSKLKVGNYEGYFRVICYDSETGEKALVQPEITDMTITVIE